MRAVIITGANGNLGIACVQKFLEEGYKVMAVDGSNSHLDFAAGNTAYRLFTFGNNRPLKQIYRNS